MRKRTVPKTVSSKPPKTPIPLGTPTLIPARQDQIQFQFENWITRGISDKRIFSLSKERFQLTWYQSKEWCSKIREAWNQEYKNENSTTRASAIKRHFHNMQRVKRQLKDKPYQQHMLLLRYEDQLAKLQGTYAPIKVDLDLTISQNIVGVVANLTPDQVASHLDAYMETQRLANAYRLANPESP